MYFWRENVFSQELAIWWFRDEQNRGKFKGDQDPRCAVIRALLTAEEDECYDLNDMETEDALLEIYKANGYANDLDAAKLFEYFIDLTEQKLGCNFKIIITRVNTPSTAKSYPWRAIGKPVCYVARDVSSITIERIDIVDN